MSTKFIRLFAYITAGLTALVFVGMIVYITREAWPFIQAHSFIDFLFGSTWKPAISPPIYQIGHVLLTTLIVALLASSLIAPFSLSISLFLVFYANTRLRELALQVISILAGIPSVIFGFYGMRVIVPLVADVFHLSTGESLLSASLILALMALPFVVRMNTDLVLKIKADHYQDSLALGISREYFIRHLVLNKLPQTLISSIMLAFTRTVGETMAVLLVIGNSPIAPRLLGRGQTISSLIALEIGMAEVGGEHYSALFAAGFVLLVLVISLNYLILRLQQRMMAYD